MSPHTPPAHASPPARRRRAGSALDATLTAIVQAAQSLPGIDEVGISVLDRDDGLECRVCTEDFVCALDQLQDALREGPSSEALSSDEPVLVNHLEAEARWPNYVPQALRVGVRAQLSVRLSLGTEVLGCLNFYATQAEAINPDLVPLVRPLAVHAALTLGREAADDGSPESAAGRRVIDQAVGLLVERYQVDEPRALQFLVRSSRASDLSLRQAAQDLVDKANAKYAAPTASAPSPATPEPAARKRPRRSVVGSA